MDINKIIGNIVFDKEGTVVGKYYGVCPGCGNKKNLVYDKGNNWVCKKCYHK